MRSKIEFEVCLLVDKARFTCSSPQEIEVSRVGFFSTCSSEQIEHFRGGLVKNLLFMLYHLISDKLYACMQVHVDVGVAVTDSVDGDKLIYADAARDLVFEHSPIGKSSRPRPGQAVRGLNCPVPLPISKTIRGAPSGVQRGIPTCPSDSTVMSEIRKRRHNGVISRELISILAATRLNSFFLITQDGVLMSSQNPTRRQDLS